MKKLVTQTIVLIMFALCLVQLIDFSNRIGSDTSLVNVYTQTLTAESNIDGTSLGEAAGRTGVRILLASVLAILLGGLYGLILFISRTLSTAVNGINIFVRAIPITFIFGPITLITNPLEFLIPAYLAAIPCAFIIADAMASQSSSISIGKRTSIEGLLRGRSFAVYTHFYAWEVIIGLFTGIRIAIPYAGILVGVLEYVGAGNKHPGFGAIINGLIGSAEYQPQLIGLVFVYGFLIAMILSIFYILLDRFIMEKLQK